MNQPEPGLDFRLNWTESEASDPPAAGDSFHTTRPSTPMTRIMPAEDGINPDPDGDGWDDTEEPQEPDGEDDFSWSAEREAQLEAAFESIPADAPARVHLQLSDIANGLREASLPVPRGLALLAEVEVYLTGRIKAEQRKPVVDHELFMSFRTDKLNALYAWQETATALREFCTSGEEVQLRIADYACQQASDSLHQAWETLQAIEPQEG